MSARPVSTAFFPERRTLRRRKRWWRKFMSPVWLLIAAPALALPLAAVVLFEEEPAPSGVEQAIAALPIPGDGSVPGRESNAPRIAALGAPGTQLPSTVSASLYSNSARFSAERLDRRTDPRDAVPDVASISFALLHPRSMADEDMLVGDLALMLSTPAGPDFSWAILNAFCETQPMAGQRAAVLQDLPINPSVPASIMNFLPASDHPKICPRLGA